MNNRQLKFRAWDRIEKRYIYPDKGYQGHYVLDLNGRFQNLQNGSGGEDYVVQQFTGTTDVDGKEIYEGDYIEFDRILTDTITKKYNGSVVWASGAFLIMGKTLDGEGTLTYIWLKDIDQKIFDYRVKVVGNSFENPDYLK